MKTVEKYLAERFTRQIKSADIRKNRWEHKLLESDTQSTIENIELLIRSGAKIKTGWVPADIDGQYVYIVMWKPKKTK